MRQARWLKWAVGLFDAERAAPSGQASRTEAWLRWVHECLASRQMTFRQIGAIAGKRLGQSAAERARPMPAIVASALDAACKE